MHGKGHKSIPTNFLVHTVNAYSQMTIVGTYRLQRSSVLNSVKSLDQLKKFSQEKSR